MFATFTTQYEADMTPEQFKEWRKWMGVSQIKAASFLGVSPRSIFLWETGLRGPDQRIVTVPKPIELACAALAQGIREYSGPS